MAEMVMEFSVNKCHVLSHVNLTTKNETVIKKLIYAN